MKLRCLGAAGEVTGSKHLLEANGSRILLDCGMFQGRRREADKKNRRELPIGIGELDAVVLTHAHVDHCGLLPVLRKQGYDGPIYATPATRDLCAVMLMDSASIQERDAKWLAKKRREFMEPLYSTRDAQATLRLFSPIPYGRRIPIARGIRLRLFDAGHILGSAMAFLEVDEGVETKTFLFSGDIGRVDHPMLNDPDPPEHADFVLMESTYGNREQESLEFADERLGAIVRETHARGGKLIIPSFALERAQEIIYVLKVLESQDAIPALPVFVDSPMAVNVTEVFRLHSESFDEDFADLMAAEGDPFRLNEIHYIRDVARSIALNDFEGPCIIVAASGMCENGRILHHLRNHCSDARNTILIVGYQAAHTLGRRIVEGQREIRVLGDSYPLEARVETITAFSCHAGRSELLSFAARYADSARKIVLVHGEEDALNALGESIAAAGSAEVIVPQYDEVITL